MGLVCVYAKHFTDMYKYCGSRMNCYACTAHVTMPAAFSCIA